MTQSLLCLSMVNYFADAKKYWNWNKLLNVKKEVQVVFLVKKISTTDCVGNGLHKSTWHMLNLYKYHKTYGGIAVCEDTE